MEEKSTGRSARIVREIRIKVSGVDCLGDAFVEDTHTSVITRHGAKIVLTSKLIPEQEIVIRCLATGKEAEALVVGLIEEEKEGFDYGVRILHALPDLWDIEFPPLQADHESVDRTALCCTRCKTIEMADLDEFELAVLEASGGLVRPCQRCADSNIWKKSLLTDLARPQGAASVPAQAIAPAEPKDRRRETRREMRVKACVRRTNASDDIVSTQNVSRHGLRFVSGRQYSPGDEIQVAVPYSPIGGNIFLPARIVGVQKLASEGIRAYGVAYR